MAKVKKYIKAIQSGKTKEQSKIIAGYSPTTTTTDIEKTNQFKEIQNKLADKLEQSITKQEVANKLADNIRSDEGSTSNTAIKLFKDIVEPDGTQAAEADKVIIIIQKKEVLNINPANINPLESPTMHQNSPQPEENIEEAVITEKGGN
jgi:hypothetical protein